MLTEKAILFDLSINYGLDIKELEDHNMDKEFLGRFLAMHMPLQLSEASKEINCDKEYAEKYFSLMNPYLRSLHGSNFFTPDVIMNHLDELDLSLLIFFGNKGGYYSFYSHYIDYLSYVYKKYLETSYCTYDNMNELEFVVKNHGVFKIPRYIKKEEGCKIIEEFINTKIFTNPDFPKIGDKECLAKVFLDEFCPNSEFRFVIFIKDANSRDVLTKINCKSTIYAGIASNIRLFRKDRDKIYNEHYIYYNYPFNDFLLNSVEELICAEINKIDWRKYEN